jgi:sugar phosphate isomerase/epimerase
VSTDPEFQRLSEHHVEADIRLASDLGARFVVLIAGRRHALSPAPEDSCMWVLRRTLERLIVLAESLDVTICLENNPYGFLGLSDELLAVADEFDTPSLGIAFDVANALGREDPTAGVRRVAGRLRVAHVSDTHANRWQHTSPGRGEVDFAAFADALLEMRFAGPTVYELADSESPENRLAADIAALGTYGWSTDLLPSPTTNSAK